MDTIKFNKIFRSWKALSAAIVAAITLISGVATILEYLHSQENLATNNRQVNSSSSVTSQNQSGGITANVVNFQKPPRQLDEAFKEVVEKINRSTKISIMCNNCNLEAYNFSNAIYNYLLRNHYNVSGVNSGIVFGLPPYPLIIDKDKNGSYAIIISNQA